MPSVRVPAYSLSSLMSKSWTFVPRPIVKRSKPVAIGSRVPQWPTFFISSFRRTSATTSCEVIPSALSTSRTPSRVGLNDVTNFLQNVPFDFGECSAHACARREGMPPAAKFLTDGTDINGITFRAHADPHFAVGQPFEKNGDDNAADRAKMIDYAFIVFRKNLQLRVRLIGQAKTRDTALTLQTHSAQQFSQYSHSATA